MERLIIIGTSLLFIGILLIFAGTLFSNGTEKSNVKVAAGGFIGPIPFGFMNDKRMIYILIALMAFSLFIWLFLNK